jgi:5-methylcytosine-specific restriction endonuclease McrA
MEVYDGEYIRCRTCGTWKLPHEYETATLYGFVRLRPQCRDCRVAVARRKQRRARFKPYRITVSEYDRLRERQNYLCAICGSQEANSDSLVVDHCHTTQKVRGLLCGNCNKGMGFLKDDPARLLAAIHYLARANGSSSNLAAVLEYLSLA